MQFDVVIGNPPYQEDIGSMTPKETYTAFILKACNLGHMVSMIVPTRWYSGDTTGYKQIRRELLGKGKLVNLVDFEKATDVFGETIQLSGGVVYFLWDNTFNGVCVVDCGINNTREYSHRHLDEKIFIRSKVGVQLAKRMHDKSVVDTMPMFFDSFGIDYQLEGSERGNLEVLTNSGMVYTDISAVTKNIEHIGKYKVAGGKMVPGGGVQKSRMYTVINKPCILKPGQAFTDSYRALGVFDTEDEANNYLEFMSDRIIRFLVHITSNSTSLSRKNFILVPNLDFKQHWGLSELVTRYSIEQSEIDYIYSIIKELR